MGLVCREVQSWVEENVEQPVEAWEDQQQERCETEPCNWWTLCLNKLVCWLVWVAVKVTRLAVVTVGKWVSRTVCEAVTLVLDAAAWLSHLVLSIPGVGGILRTVLNWSTELFWRGVGLIDFAGSLLGIRLRKRIYVGVLIPRANGVPVATEAQILPQIQQTDALFRALANVEIVYTGACTARLNAPDQALNIQCDFEGFFSDWWVGGSYLEFASANCKFDDGWRRLVGYGGQILVIPVQNVAPDSAQSATVGCSFISSQNFVLVEPTADPFTAAHEIGHNCWLTHSSNSANLMYDDTLSTPSPTLTSWQVSLLRGSKHCVYI
jgi:hypothetical protein